MTKTQEQEPLPNLLVRSSCDYAPFSVLAWGLLMLSGIGAIVVGARGRW